MNDEKMIHAHGGIRRENYGRKQEATYGCCGKLYEFKHSQRPDAGIRSLGIIGWDTVVKVCDDESVSGFYKVKTGDGISGYCMSEFIKLC